MIGAARTDGEAADELMKALRRKDSSVLDVLVECLKEQEAANANLISSIREGEWVLIPSPPPMLPLSSTSISREAPPSSTHQCEPAPANL